MLKITLCFSIFISSLISSSIPVYAQNNTFSHTLNFESSTSEYNWVTSPWSECDIPCGGTQVTPPAFLPPAPSPGQPRLQYRTIECRDNLGNVRPDSDCSYSVKPAAQRACANAPACTWNIDCTSGSKFCLICILLVVFFLAMCATGNIAACAAAA